MNVTYEPRQEQEEAQVTQRPNQYGKAAMGLQDRWLLRARLFGVDVIVKRTLVYGTLTAVLALIYFGSVLLLQHLFHSLTGQGSPLIVAGSTLVIALLFQPLRNHIQKVIDRRFYHCKCDAIQTLNDFEDRLRMYDELDLSTLTNDVIGVIKATMQPTLASLLLVEPVLQEHLRDDRGWQNTQAEQPLEKRLQAGQALAGHQQADRPQAGPPRGLHLPYTEDEQQPVEVQVSVSYRESAATTHLVGYTLLIARAAWVILAVCTLGLFLAALPFRFSHLHVICANIMCGGSQSIVDVADRLRSLGLSVHAYATYSLTLQIMFALVYFTIAAVIFWRKSNDRMALLVALFMMTFVLAFTDVPGVLTKAYPAWTWPIKIISFIGEISFPAVLLPVPRWALRTSLDALAPGSMDRMGNMHVLSD